MSLVFFNTFEFMLSTPAEDVSLRLSIRDKIPSAKKVTDGMTLVELLTVEGNDKLGSWEKTDTKAVLKRLAHSTSSTVSPFSLTNEILLFSRGLITCQNFLGLVTSMFGRSS